MLRASACHNYSAESDDSARVSTEGLVQGAIAWGSWPDRDGFQGKEGESRRNHGVRAFLCDSRGAAAGRPHVGEAAPERPLDATTGSRHRAAPSTARCRPRSFAHANYLGLNLRERGRPSQVAGDNDVETGGGREVSPQGDGWAPLHPNSSAGGARKCPWRQPELAKGKVASMASGAQDRLGPF